MIGVGMIDWCERRGEDDAMQWGEGSTCRERHTHLMPSIVFTAPSDVIKVNSRELDLVSLN
jgi:hypothetical protein